MSQEAGRATAGDAVALPIRPGPHPLDVDNAVSAPPEPPRRRMRNLVVIVVALQILAMCAWTLLPERSDPNAYAFTETQEDGETPVAYDPCRPIHYVVRQEGSPPGGQQLITDAVERVSEVTGLTFVYDGSTDKSSADWQAVNPLDSDRWAPVVMAWETPEENPELAGDVAGAGGSTSRSFDGSPRVYVSGAVSFDGPDMRKILAGPRGRHEARAVILHELGHLVGLDHVNDKDQLMYPTVQRGTDEFSAGDLTGLAALGRGPCVPRLQKP